MVRHTHTRVYRRRHDRHEKWTPAPNILRIDRRAAHFPREVGIQYPTEDIQVSKTYFLLMNDEADTYTLSLMKQQEDYTNNDVVLDSSGNSLHSRISNFKITSRGIDAYRFSSGSVVSPLFLEKESRNPVLFPTAPNVVSLNTELLLSGSSYDANNPNLITKLVPSHYLLEQAEFEGFTQEDGDIADPYSYQSKNAIPGGGKLGSPQIVAALLFTWAKYFDEMKIFLDQFSNLLHVDYDDEGTVASQFLPFLGEYYGFRLPNMYSNSSLDQLVEGDDLTVDPSNSTLGLQSVQNHVWRRILINLNEIVQSKGTVHSIKTLMRSAGISPDDIFRFREFGGSPRRDLTEARRSKTTVSSMLDMSGTLLPYPVPETRSPQGFSDVRPFVQSPFLSASRVEPGYPPIKGTFVKDNNTVIGTTDANDKLLTSGSWTYEAIYKFEPIVAQAGHGGMWNREISHPLTQSLVRLFITGSDYQIGEGGLNKGAPFLIANILAFHSTSYPNTASLKAFVRPGTKSDAPVLEFSLPNTNIFDGNKWRIAFGRERNDQFGSVVSSSYFLRAGRQSFGDLVEYTSASVLFEENPTDTSYPGGVLQNFGQLNVSGAFFAIGSQSIETTPVGSWYPNMFLNSITATPGDQARRSIFSGRVSHMRFWSKALTNEEVKEHSRNFGSLGVQDPSKNFNFVTTRSGSFEKLRIDATTDQIITMSNASGDLQIFDYSQNNFHLSASSFEVQKRAIRPERFDYSMLDPKFDEFSQDNKIRIRSWQRWENVSRYGGEVAPAYEVRKSEQPVDDTRFSIEVSSVQALNEDIINIFATFDALDSALGNPELLFATEYPELATLREVYFNRLDRKINLKSFFEFFKWFDSSLGILVERLIPRRTKFLGVNFVIESHMLERAKFNYNYADIYVGENNRHGLKGTILLRQLVGTMKRF